jgi:hypothetical protein
MRKSLLALVLVLFVLSCWLSGCSDAEVASYNTSRSADQFEIYRRVVFYNGITDSYIMTIEGYCSIEKEEDGMIRVMVKTEDGKYLKHYLVPSDNVTMFAEQLRPSKVSTGHYRVIFKPSVIIPDIDIR